MDEGCFNHDEGRKTSHMFTILVPTPAPTIAPTPAPTPASSPTTLPDDGAAAGNVRVPDSGCNVCGACCASYLSDQGACDGCVTDECAVTNVCVPDAGCNVCDACCASYLSGQDACEVVDEDECC